MIAEILNTGKDNPLTAREIGQLLGISTRHVRQQIENERRAGAPICAINNSNPGYYLASDAQDMREYCARLYHHEHEITQTRKACLLTVDALPEREPGAIVYY